MKDLSRRQFNASLAASLFLLPFLKPSAAQAAAGRAKRLFVMTSIGTYGDYWTPKDVRGENSFTFGELLSPLDKVRDKLILVDGLSFKNPTSGHAQSELITANGALKREAYSVDQFIAERLAALGGQARLDTLPLGVQAANGSNYWRRRSGVNPIDDPQDALKAILGAGASPAPSGAAPAAGFSKDQRQNILKLVEKQLKALGGQVGKEEAVKIENHLHSLTKIQSTFNMPPPSSLQCAAPMLSIGAATDTATIGRAQLDVIVSAFTCDATRIAGLQWGTGQNMFLSNPDTMGEMHSMMHNGQQYKRVFAGEQFLSQCFADFLTKLDAIPEPNGSGTLLDNSLLLWARDMSDGPNHRSYNMSYVLAGGAGGYLRLQKGGRYLNYGGSDKDRISGQPHERLLVSVCEAMGIEDLSGFGSLPAAEKKALAELKATP